MDAKLVVVGGEAKSGEVKIKKLPSIVGRGDDADIRLRHPLVSRKHCEIYEQNGLLKVRDLGSLNGTFIANNKVKEATLKPDELITIGPVVFRAVYEGPASAEDDADEDFDLDLGDFEIDETQPVDIKKTTAARETVMLDEMDNANERPIKSSKKGGAKAAEDDVSDLDLDFELDFGDDQTKGAAAEQKSPAEAAATDVAMDDDAFADLMELEIEDVTADEPPSKKPSKEPAKKDAKAAAKAAAPAPLADDEFDIQIDGDGGEDGEFDDFLKDLGLEK